MTNYESVARKLVARLDVTDLSEIITSEYYTDTDARELIAVWHEVNPDYKPDEDDYVTDKTWEACLVPPGEDLTDGWEYGMYESYQPTVIPGLYLVYTRKGNSVQSFFHSALRMTKKMYGNIMG